MMSEDALAADNSDSEEIPEVEVIDAEEESQELTIEEQLEAALQRAESAEKEIVYRDADIVNIRKRHAKERTDLIRYGGQGLARKLTALLDDFDRALSAVPADMDDALLEGIKMIHNNLEKALVSYGATKIDAASQKFNPNIMEAVTTIPASEEYPPSTVVQVLEQGWMLHDRVLRAARVVVTAVE